MNVDPSVDSLPPEYFNRAKEYIEEGRSIQSQLNSAFVWSNTLEGDYFWYRCETVLVENLEPYEYPIIPDITNDDYKKGYIADAKIKEVTLEKMKVWNGLVYVWVPKLHTNYRFFNPFVTPLSGQFELNERYYKDHFEWLTIIKRL